METKPDTILFKESKIRYVWDEELEEYYFSVTDVVGVLSESKNPRDYRYRLKKRELENGVDLSTNCRQLNLKLMMVNCAKRMLQLKNNYSVSYNQYFHQMPNHLSNG